MSEVAKPTVLLQLDSDPHASSFDAVVAADCEVDHILQYQDVSPDGVQGLVHGAIFTRGPSDLHRTAIFVGGTDVRQGEALLKAVCESFFGPMRVSVLLDANGANTTAVAAVWCAGKHLDLASSQVVVLAGTGAVGQRVARLLAHQGSKVHVASRSFDRAVDVCNAVSARVPTADVQPLQGDDVDQVAAALSASDAVIAAGAAGVQLLPQGRLPGCIQVAIDLNAVPPLGIEGVDVMDRGEPRDGIACYGAIGVGATKMKLHKAAIRRLFTANDQVLDAEEIWQLASELDR